VRPTLTRSFAWRSLFFMSFAPKPKTLTSSMRSASLLVVAVLLLLTPVCGVLCQGRMCDPPLAGAEKSACHESLGAAADPFTRHIGSIRGCTLQELPIALPASFRSAAGEFQLLAHSEHHALSLGVPAIELAPARQFSLRFSSLAASPSLSAFASSSLVLRI
jgi:hypothetical protein